MLVEYFLAGYFGRAWLAVSRRVRRRLAALPGWCGQVARGQDQPASQLGQVQEFAVRAWWRFGLVAAVLLLPVIGAGAAIRPGRIGTDVGVCIMVVLVAAMGVAGAEMAVIRFRAFRTSTYLLRYPAKGGQPLPPGSAGLPRQSDFWLTFAVALAVVLVLLYAGTRSAHG